MLCHSTNQICPDFRLHLANGCKLIQKEEDTEKRPGRKINTDIVSLYSSLSGAIRGEGVGGGGSAARLSDRGLRGEKKLSFNQPCL